MKILIVDDSKTIRFMIIRILKELGYADYAEAENVDQAISLIETTQLPGLILSDINMPGKSGIDFLKYIRSNAATTLIPFIMITTVHEKKTIFEAVRAGLQDYLIKPIDKGVLLEKIRSLAENHHIEQPPIQIAPGK